MKEITYVPNIRDSVADAIKLHKQNIIPPPIHIVDYCSSFTTGDVDTETSLTLANWCDANKVGKLNKGSELLLHSVDIKSKHTNSYVLKRIKERTRHI
jgi:hypothetical protein